MTILEENILHHVNDGLCLTKASINSPLKKYLALMTLDSKTFSIEKILHYCFPNMAKLKANKFLKPNPNFSFITHNLSHTIQFTPFLPLFPKPHQYEFIIF